MNAIVSEWVKKAEGDFATAQRELRARLAPNYDSACFHAQQCAEKYLKAFLVLHGHEPPRTHNLVELLRLGLNLDTSLEMLRPTLEMLNTYAVDVRYPGEFATREEARDSVRLAKQVREIVQVKL